MKTPMGNLVIMRLLKLVYILMVTMIFYVCWKMFYMPCLNLTKLSYGLTVGLLYLILFVLLGRIYEVFSVGTYRVSHLVFSQGLSLLLIAGMTYVLMTVAAWRFTNPLPLLGAFAAQGVWSVLWSWCTNRIYYALHKPKKTVIIYESENDRSKLEEVRHFDRKFAVVKHIPLTENVSFLLEQIEDAEAVFLPSMDIDDRNEIVKYCVNNDIQCYVQPRVGDLLMAGAKHMQMFSVPLVRVRKEYHAPEYLFFKRALDIVASLLAIIVLSPFMLVTAIAIKAQDGGPVLYKQVRLTKDRKEFKVWKFRSMRVDAEKDGVARLSTENDDRITPVGHVIRKIRFDELPQLFNILKGDMTIVGPRPERPEIARQYEEEIPSFGLRLQVKAGLTGYAQIYGKYNTEPYDKLKMDLMYINNMSFMEDLRLIFATIKILFVPDSTEGIAEGQTTASKKETEEKETVQV